MILFRRCYIAFVLLFISCGSSSLYADTREDVTYRFGVVPQFEQRYIREVWKPVLIELEKRTGYKFMLDGSSSIAEFEDQYLKGDFDFAFMNPYFVLKAAKHGYIPLVRDVESDLHGILVVRKDSSIKDVADLLDSDTGFPAPNALGASMMLRADMKNKFSLQVLPVYMGTHSAVYRSVLDGKVVAGGGVQKSLSQQPYYVRNALKVIYKTKSFPSHPIMAHHRVPIIHREKIVQSLLDIASTAKGKALLSKIPMQHMGITSTTDYQPISTWGLEAFYLKH